MTHDTIVQRNRLFPAHLAARSEIVARTRQLRYHPSHDILSDSNSRAGPPSSHPTPSTLPPHLYPRPPYPPLPYLSIQPPHRQPHQPALPPRHHLLAILNPSSPASDSPSDNGHGCYFAVVDDDDAIGAEGPVSNTQSGDLSIFYSSARQRRQCRADDLGPKDRRGRCVRKRRMGFVVAACDDDRGTG